MGSVPPLLSFLLMIVSGWVHRHQLIVIEFLQAENQVLKKRLGGKRIRFTDAERALLGERPRRWGAKPCLNSTPSFLPIRCCGGIGSSWH